MKRKWVYPLAAWAFLAAPSFARAEIECSELPHVRPGMECVNTGGEEATRVTIRHMPPWGPNAGLVLVDMCPVPVEEIKCKNSDDEKCLEIAAHPVSLARLPEQDKIPEEVPFGCFRRYCTDRIREFAISVQGSMIPIGPWFALGLTIGFEFSTFRIQCENLTPWIP